MPAAASIQSVAGLGHRRNHWLDARRFDLFQKGSILGEKRAVDNNGIIDEKRQNAILVL
jgi:hypothetical protein